MKTKLKYQLTFKWIQLLKKLGRPKKRQFKNADYSRILIISNTGIGDTMWGTPALSMIREKYPQSHISILTSPLSHQILLHNPHPNELILLKNSGGLTLLSHFFRLYKKKFDTVIVFHSSYKWVIPFCYFLSPKHFIAFKHDAKMFDYLLTDVLEAKLNHPIIQRLMLAKKIGVTQEEFQIKIYLQKSEEKKAEKFIMDLKIDPNKPIIGMQPGASEPFKRWPTKNFALLAQKLHLELEAQIVIFGNLDEIPLANEIKKSAPIFLAAGQIPLRVSCALIKKMDVFITNDTGPLHLAIAQKVPLLTFFGPTPCHLCWPHLKDPKVRIMFKPVPCIKCVNKRCQLPFCMELLEVQDAFNHVKQLLSLENSLASVH